MKQTEDSVESEIEVDFSKYQPNSKAQIKEHKVSTKFILLFMLTAGINGIPVAWTTGGNNQTANIFAAKLGWSALETRRNNTMINFASQIGKAIGATIGGRLIPGGRRRVFIYGNVLAILSCLIMQYLSLYTLVAGKFLNGLFVTVVHIAAIKMINETIPVYLLGSYGTII